MSVSVEQLRQYTGAASGDADFLGSCLTEATALVARFVGSVVIPSEVQDRAALEVASELFHRRQAPNGIAQFATVDGASPIRVARDPLVAAYPLLTPWTGVGVG
jgi:hypothetical protein